MPYKCKVKQAAYLKQYRIDNKESAAAYAKKWHINNKESTAAYMKSYNLKISYGLTDADYDSILEAQHGCCPICLKHHTEFPKRLAVDHIHDRVGSVDYNRGVSGAVRGLLCDRCNRGIGFLGDSIDNILRLLAYKLGSDLCPFTLTKRETDESD